MLHRVLINAIAAFGASLLCYICSILHFVHSTSHLQGLERVPRICIIPSFRSQPSCFDAQRAGRDDVGTFPFAGDSIDTGEICGNGGTGGGVFVLVASPLRLLELKVSVHDIMQAH